MKSADYFNFRVRYFKGEFPHQRLGQAFCIHFDIHNPNLFYADMRRAEKIIAQEYLEDCQYEKP